MAIYFKQMLLRRIAEKKVFSSSIEKFQDLHWDDVYNVYYDSAPLNV